MKLKICGMKYPDNLSEVAALAPDYLGFIFYPKSRRYVAETLYPETVRGLPATIRRAGVFVNATTQYVQEVAERYGLHTLQLHGQETPEQCQALRQLGYEVIKVFSVSASFNFDVLNPYPACVDAFLFDTATPQHGGSGRPFDWSILADYQLPVPFFLSGGISLDNLKEALRIEHPRFVGIDVNSRFETAPGQKDVARLRKLTGQLGR